MKQHTEEKQPWVSCFLTNILVSHIEETAGRKKFIDCASLFRTVEGFEVPADPQSYLKDVNNWVPLAVLRELHLQCETISGKKDIGYHAARAYFDPEKKQLPSLNEIIARVLHDVRSLLICADLWASVHTNYLKFQSFEGPGRDLYMLAQFEENARPSVGAMHSLRGICEGFIRRCPFIADVKCTEELTQVQIQDITREFPGFEAIQDGERLSVRRSDTKELVAEADKIPLRSEDIFLSKDFMGTMPDAIVVPPRKARIDVLTSLEETDPHRRRHAPTGYKIVRSGTVSHGPLSYSLNKGQVYNAPYCRLRFTLTERIAQARDVSTEQVSRREVSRLLFDHLKQIKQAQMYTVQSNIEKRHLTLENLRLRQEIAREYGITGIIGHSHKMQELLGLVRSIAPTDVTVLIHGETGTGKELIARAIHHNSPRSSRRFLAVNCGSLTETLLESELFGHERGAFTGATTQRKGIFEVVDAGTLFLDEIGEIPPSTQVKLLRVLQEGEFQRVGGTTPIKVDVRIVAATNQNLAQLIEQGRFRKDLYYRLNVVPIQIPPLRERVDDIPLLVAHFIEKCNRKMNKNLKGMSPQAMSLLMTHGWPGNVRELENVIQRMAVVSRSDLLDVSELPPEIQGTEQESQEKAKDLKGIARGSAEAVEKHAILGALAKTGGNVSHAARVLGISRVTLQKKMKTYNLRGRTR